MAIETTITCDVCGRKKGKTNHWWSLCLENGDCNDGPHVAIYPGILVIDEGIVEYACGEQHAHQLAGDLMKRLPQDLLL